MKTKLTNLVMLLFVIYSGFGQSYEPLVRDDAHWVVADLDDWPVWHNVNFREYYTDGDSLLGDISYKKLYRYTLTASDIWGDPPYVRTGNPSLFALLREDTMARIVYGQRFNVDPGDCFYTEDTLFDFSANQYDTLELCIGYAVPITFDTVYYNNIFGYYRKHFIVDFLSIYAGVQLYEGIGSTNGLFEGIGFAFKKDLLGTELKCYTLGDISNCDILTQSKESFVADIKMYPNPLFGENLYVRLPGGNGQNVKAIVSDVYGKRLYEYILGEGSNKIGLGGLNKGLYFIKISNENKLLLNKKRLKL